MKKIFILLCLLICLCSCSNTAIKKENYSKIELKTFTTKKKNIEFLGVKNNQLLSNEFDYSYFVQNLATAFEKQGIMLDRSGYLADEINLTNLKEYNTENRYLVFAEIKNYNFDFKENKEDVSGAEHLVYGIYTLGIGNLIAETYSNTNRLTYFQYKLDVNFYIFDKKLGKITQKIPITIDDLTAIEGSFSNTDESTQKEVYKNYLFKIYNELGEKISKKL